MVLCSIDIRLRGYCVYVLFGMINGIMDLSAGIVDVVNGFGSIYILDIFIEISLYDDAFLLTMLWGRVVMEFSVDMASECR